MKRITRPYLYAAVLVLASAASAGAGLLDCTGCHGEPGDMRPVDSPYRNISTGGFRGNHRTHLPPAAGADNCAICHGNSGYTTIHRDKLIRLTTRINNYSGRTGAARYLTTRANPQDGAAIFFNQTSHPVLASCVNANCHFETTSPTWGDDAAAANLNCSSCHGNPPAASSTDPSDGSHRTHASASYYALACAACHPDHTLDAAPFAHATSIGTRELAVTPGSGQYIPGGDRNYLPSQKGSHTFGTCSATYCHSNGTRRTPPYVSNSAPPRWGDPAAAACGSCHKATSDTGFPVISSAGHTLHFTANAGPYLGTTITACQTCHAYGYTTHVNNTVEKNPCTPCHPGTEPVWTSRQLACEECHGKNPSVAVMSSISAPNTWTYYSAPRSAGGGHGFACTNCHGTHTEPYTYDNGRHISGIKGDWQGLNRYWDGTPYVMSPVTWQNTSPDNNNCTYCHNPLTTGEKKTHVRTPGEGTGASMTCVACHDTHGAGNLHMLRGTIWYDAGQAPVEIRFTNATTLVQYAPPYQGPCQVCHTLTGHFRRGVAEPSAAGQHGDIAYRNCVSCHDHGTKIGSTPSSVDFAFQTPRCDTCHGYPPVEDMTGLGRQNAFSTAKLETHPGSGGAHAAFGHLSPTIKATDRNPWLACQPCHSGGSSTHLLAANAAQVQFAASYNANSGSASYASSCYNVSCHGGASVQAPVWTSSPGWFAGNGDLSTSSCMECHAINTFDDNPGLPENNSPYSGLDPNYAPYYANLHDAHVVLIGFNCTDYCHDPSSASLGKASNHFASLSTASMNRAWQTLRSTSFTYTKDLPVGKKGTCSNVDSMNCHFDGDTQPRIW